jgi:predicted AlkP superfamily pyrophosphatase or phosphodiesterase
VTGVQTCALPISAITSFNTGLAPQQHALVGWYTYIKEFGSIATILPFYPRGGSKSYAKDGFVYSDCFNAVSFYENLGIKSYVVNPKSNINSLYTKKVSKGAKRIPYSKTLASFFSAIKKTVKKKDSKKFVYAYWPVFDAICHYNGPKSKLAFKHFKEIDKRLKKLCSQLKGTNTTLIITADHGFIDTPLDKYIMLNFYPKIYECMSMPASGDSRVSYCYVHPSKAKQFERNVKKELGFCCTLHKSKDLVKKNYFGLYDINPKFLERIGDYVLIAKDDYVVRDFMPNETINPFLGSHSGMSKQELYVPLIVIKP